VSLSLESFIVFLLFVLPGLTAYTYTRNYIPRARPLTPLEELVAALQNAVIVHLAGLAILVIGFLVWERSVSPTGLELLVSDGIGAYFKQHPVRTASVVVAYAVYLLAAGPAFGVLNVYRRLSNGVLDLLRLIGQIPLLAWIVPPTLLVDESVWWQAIEGSRSAERPNVWAFVRMKNKDVYTGWIAAYPLLGDEVAAKDFFLEDARYYAAQQAGEEAQADKAQGNEWILPTPGGVLINTSNVDSIEFTALPDPDSLD
jgi:Family of unknown function (DUF6338)